ncbi:DUF6482 family protein [Vibrio sp.]|nr:DUF6482 family protein [Vibrio sp.]
MQQHQLDKWIHGYHKDSYQPPKIFVIGCSDLPQYLLAVEYKHQLEPIRIDDEVVHFESMDQVREALMQLGAQRAYLRLHNTYDECGSPDPQRYYDIELSLFTH